MNTSNDGQTIAIIKDNPKMKRIKISVTDDTDDKTKKYFNNIKIDEGKFQLTFDKDKDRFSIFIVGRNGSGKSYYIKDLIKEFKKVYPTYSVRLFSSKDEDENLDKIEYLKRVILDESFVTNPLEYTTLEKSLVIFDDIDGLKGNLKKEIYHLRDIILKNGRSYNIHIICTNHDSTGRDVQAPLNESDVIVFFMKNYNRSMKYLLENYIGLDKNQTKVLRKNKSRATAYIKTYPNVILQERNMYTLEGIPEDLD